MQSQRSLESPLVVPSFAHVSRHMDVGTVAALMASRTLPSVFDGDKHFTLAHTLYWAERDREDGVNCAIREEPLAQTRTGYYNLRTPAYFESVRNLDQATITMIENCPELPVEYLAPEHAKVHIAHQLYWEGRPRIRPAVIEHSV